MKAEKHLGKCDEECKYNAIGVCAFGLRNRVGCFLDDEIKKIASEIISNARSYNIKESIESIVKLNLP